MLALGLLYATTSLVGEVRYAQGWWASKDFKSALAAVEEANRIFPLEYRIRSAPAYLLTASRPPDVPVERAIAAAKESLKTNPYAADMRANLLKLSVDSKDLKMAKEQFEELKKLVPDNALVKRLSAAGF